MRAYLDKPVEREKIERCLEAARLAPSACNSQPWRFIVVDEPELKDRVAAASIGSLKSINVFVPHAPVLVAVIAQRSKLTAAVGGMIKKKNFSLIDIGIATEHFCLQAAAEGLDSCILGWFDEEEVKRLLGVPGRKRIELLITVGYPDESPAETRPKQRKPPDQGRSYNRYKP